MVFGFLKRNKKDKNEKVTGTDGFWENCVTTSKRADITPNGEIGPIKEEREFHIPFEDIRRNFDDESYLKNIVKNQNEDLHRRTAALLYLFNIHNMGLDWEDFYSLLNNEGLFSDPDDTFNLLNDFSELNKVLDGAILMLG